MNGIAIFGIDLAKKVIQMHGSGHASKCLVHRELRCSGFRKTSSAHKLGVPTRILEGDQSKPTPEFTREHHSLCKKRV